MMEALNPPYISVGVKLLEALNLPYNNLDFKQW